MRYFNQVIALHQNFNTCTTNLDFSTPRELDQCGRSRGLNIVDQARIIDATCNCILNMLNKIYNRRVLVPLLGRPCTYAKVSYIQLVYKILYRRAPRLAYGRVRRANKGILHTKIQLKL